MVTTRWSESSAIFLKRSLFKPWYISLVQLWLFSLWEIQSEKYYETCHMPCVAELFRRLLRSHWCTKLRDMGKLSDSVGIRAQAQIV